MGRWCVSLLVAVVVVLCGSGCGGLWEVIAREGLCKERADYENALVRDALSPVLAQMGMGGSMEDQDDCDSSSYGSYVSVHVANAEPEDVVAAFVRAGWSGGPVSERSRDCVGWCRAYELSKKVGERIVGVSLEGSTDVDIWVSAADDCWDADGYRCPA